MNAVFVSSQECQVGREQDNDATRESPKQKSLLTTMYQRMRIRTETQMVITLLSAVYCGPNAIMLTLRSQLRLQLQSLYRYLRHLYPLEKLKSLRREKANCNEISFALVHQSTWLAKSMMCTTNERLVFARRHTFAPALVRIILIDGSWTGLSCSGRRNEQHHNI